MLEINAINEINLPNPTLKIWLGYIGTTKSYLAVIFVYARNRFGLMKNSLFAFEGADVSHFLKVYYLR